MNTTKHGRLSIIVDKEDYEELERRANRSAKEVQQEARQFAVTLCKHLRNFKRDMHPIEIADFIETRISTRVEELT